MFIHTFQASLSAPGESFEVRLPLAGTGQNLKLDPRVVSSYNWRFDCHYHDDGKTVTLTSRKDDGYKKYVLFKMLEMEMWVDDMEGQLEYPRRHSFEMRVYDPKTETLPDFTSTTYHYLAVPNDKVPIDTIEVIIDPSVKTIQKNAFRDCKKMKRCIMHDEVKTIEEYAFANCHSLQAIFLPTKLEQIDSYAFSKCTNLRIISLPVDMGIWQMGFWIMHDCDSFFRNTRLQQYVVLTATVDLAIVDFHRNLPPLHKICLDPNVSSQSIHECILAHGEEVAYDEAYGGLTPMHILALNPHATTGAIMTLFQANICAVFERYADSTENECDVKKIALGSMRPLDILLEYNFDTFVLMIQALCIHRKQKLDFIQEKSHMIANRESSGAGTDTTSNETKKRRISLLQSREVILLKNPFE